MTIQTVVTESGGYMIGIRRALVIGLMALIAIRVSQLIIAIRVARLACRRQVHSRQCKVRLAVIER